MDSLVNRSKSIDQSLGRPLILQKRDENMSVKSERSSSHDELYLDRQAEAPGHLLHLPEKSLSDGSVGRRRNNPADGYRTKQRVLHLRMTAKMKGLIKGLSYIAHIFETGSKEHEMQIGYPTDVKHVAHIGWDGTSMNSPSWMKEFSSAPLSTVGRGKDVPSPITRRPSRGASTGGSMVRDSPEVVPRPRRRQTSSTSGGSPLADVSRQSSSGHNRLNREFNGRRRSRSHQRSGGLSNGGMDSPTNGFGSSSKQLTRRRKSKGSSAGGSSSSPRRKSKALAANFSDPVCKTSVPTVEHRDS